MPSNHVGVYPFIGNPDAFGRIVVFSEGEPSGVDLKTREQAEDIFLKLGVLLGYREAIAALYELARKAERERFQGGC